MKPVSSPTPSKSWSLEETLSRLSADTHVSGILLLGSTGTVEFTPASDIDALVVFSTLPAPLRIVNTWIDGRLAEIYCTTVDALDRIVSAESPYPDGSEEATVLGWLSTGRVYADRHGHLQQMQARAEDAPLPALPDDAAIYEAWRKMGYNVAQVKRYLVGDDPLSQTAIDLRLLYSIDEVKIHYFTVRRLPWRGEKPAIRYWSSHDPDFLAQLRQYFEEADREQRVARYERLARLALAPVAGLWGAGDTAISLGAGYGTGASTTDPEPEIALAFWQGLLDNTPPNA